MPLHIDKSLTIADRKKLAYHYWFLFMRLSKTKKRHWAKEVRTFFADIDKTEFNSWWEGIEDIVVHPEYGCIVLNTEEEFTQFNDEYGIIVTLNLFSSKRQILKDVSEIIDRLMPSKAQDLPAKQTGLGKFIPLSPDLPLASKVSRNQLVALGKMYDVYLACESADRNYENGEPYEYRYQIGRRLDLIPSNRKDDDSATRNETSVIVSRYHRLAKQVIANAELGIFPSHAKL